MDDRPFLTVRALAELMQLPLYEQVRILSEQKYPREAPQRFRIPYYSPALTGIREFYRVANDPDVLESARDEIRLTVKNQARRNHNLRVLDAFEASDQSQRQLKMRRIRRLEAQIEETILRLTFDIVGREQGRERYIFYNFRVAPIDVNAARIALEVTSIVTARLGLNIPIGSMEYVDLSGETTYRANKVRRTTEQRMLQNLAIIQTIWPTI